MIEEERYSFSKAHLLLLWFLCRRPVITWAVHLKCYICCTSSMPRHCSFSFSFVFFFFVLQLLLALGLCSDDPGGLDCCLSIAILGWHQNPWKTDYPRMQGSWPANLLWAGVCRRRSRRSCFLFFLHFGLWFSFTPALSSFFLLNSHFLHLIGSGSHTNQSVGANLC